jgi:hypothetical protein
MSLQEMMKSGLPMNRKERYFTGTVFPMIVCADGFRHLDVFAELIPGCRLPRIEAAPAQANIQFFTEYSLVESIYGRDTKKRFPDPPKTKDTPDIVILIMGEKSLLIALEAKMYHQPQVHSLVTQLKAQRILLAYLKRRLAVDEVWHAALLPKGFLSELDRAVPAGHEDSDFPIIRWEDLLEKYRAVRPQGDYFIGVLDLALRDWKTLCSQPLAYGLNAERMMKGGVIHRLFETGQAPRVMGRSGGLWGPTLAEDIASGNWRTQDYEVSSAAEPPNKNWFYVGEFVEVAKAAKSGVATATPSPSWPLTQRQTKATTSYDKMTGAEIMARVGDPSVKTVGRQGGLHGSLLASDIEKGEWRTWAYAVSPEPVPLNKNWFTVEEFGRRVMSA